MCVCVFIVASDQCVISPSCGCRVCPAVVTEVLQMFRPSLQSREPLVTQLIESALPHPAFFYVPHETVIDDLLLPERLDEEFVVNESRTHVLILSSSVAHRNTDLISDH